MQVNPFRFAQSGRLPLLYFLLFGSVFSPSANASTITISNFNTATSVVEVSVSLDSEAKRIWIMVSKAGDSQTEDEFFKADTRTFTKKIYLRNGMGKYRIIVLQTARDAEDATDYARIGRLVVHNINPVEDSFLLPSGQVQSDEPGIILLAKKITAGLPDDYSKSKAIHDWVASTIAYDTVTLFSGNLRTYSALETFQTHLATCDGYANLNAALHRAVGIQAKVDHGSAAFEGKTFEHAWNEVYLANRWVTEDTTWDAGGVDLKTKKFVSQPGDEYFDAKADFFYLTHGQPEVMDQ